MQRTLDMYAPAMGLEACPQENFEIYPLNSGDIKSERTL